MWTWNHLLINAFLLLKRDASSQVGPCSNFFILGHLHQQLLKKCYSKYKDFLSVDTKSLKSEHVVDSCINASESFVQS